MKSPIGWNDQSSTSDPSSVFYHSLDSYLSNVACEFYQLRRKKRTRLGFAPKVDPQTMSRVFPTPSTSAVIHSRESRARERTRAASAVDVAGFAASGGVAACVSHSLSVPLDVIKTRLQVEKFEDERVLSVARDIAARDGLLALASGWESTFLGYAVQGSLKYGGFEALKAVAFGASEGPWVASDHRLVTLLACASCAEIVGSAFLTPLEQIRIKTVSDDTYGADFFSAARRFASEDGLASVAENLPVIYAKMIPYTAVQLASYDALTTSLGPYFSDDAVLAKRLLSAVLAGVMASLASQPGDTLLSVRNKSKDDDVDDDKALSSTTTDEKTIIDSDTGIAVVSPPRKGKETVLDAAARLGPFGLMTGWRARILHVTSIVVVQLLVYDYMKSILAN